MSKIYSPEELNSFSRETLLAVILSMQDQLSQLNANMERLIEQIAVSIPGVFKPPFRRHSTANPVWWIPPFRALDTEIPAK